MNQGHKIFKFDTSYDILILIFPQGVHLGGHFLPKSGHFDLKMAINETPFKPCKLAAICTQRPLDLGLYLFRLIFYHHFGMAISSLAGPFKTEF